MYCKWCGKKLEDGVKFCPTCGYEVSRIEEVKVTPQPTIVINENLNKTEHKKLKVDKHAIAGFVLSIMAVFWSQSHLGIFLSVLGAIYCISGLFSTQKRRFAITGIMISSFACILSIIWEVSL